MSTKEKPEVIFVLGLPGAGKSHFIRLMREDENFPLTEPCFVINMDDLRLAYGHIYSEPLELTVNALALTMMETALAQGHNVIIDESITTTWRAGAFVALAHKYGAHVGMVELAADPELCWSRREKTGFPKSEWELKRLEWQANRTSILSLADEYIHLTPNDIKEAHAQSSTTAITH